MDAEAEKFILGDLVVIHNPHSELVGGLMVSASDLSADDDDEALFRYVQCFPQMSVGLVLDARPMVYVTNWSVMDRSVKLLINDRIVWVSEQFLIRQ